MHNPEIIIIPVIFAVFYLSLRALFNHRARMKMIDKGMASEDMQNYLAGDKIELTGFNWTKFGLVIFTLGVANLVSDTMYFDDSTRFSVYMIAVGLVILISPKFESILNKK